MHNKQPTTFYASGYLKKSSASLRTQTKRETFHVTEQINEFVSDQTSPGTATWWWMVLACQWHDRQYAYRWLPCRHGVQWLCLASRTTTFGAATAPHRSQQFNLPRWLTLTPIRTCLSVNFTDGFDVYWRICFRNSKYLVLEKSGPNWSYLWS